MSWRARHLDQCNRPCMLPRRRHCLRRFRLWLFFLTLMLATASPLFADGPAPVLDYVFPAGGQAGTQSEMTVAGSGLEGLTAVQCSCIGIVFERIEDNSFRVRIPDEALPGLYDLRVFGPRGLSSPRTFCVGGYDEQNEVEPNDTASTAHKISLNTTVNGLVNKKGDLDHFRFQAHRGERIVIECWAERIDSPLRAVLEIYDAHGRRVAVNRGYFGIDPLIDFVVPADGEYIIRLFDLVYAGGDSYVYRLDVGHGPRVAFAQPAIVQRDKLSKVTFVGWNLTQPDAGAQSDPSVGDGFDRLDMELRAPGVKQKQSLPLRLRPAQATVSMFAHHLPGSHVPIPMAVTDLPVVREGDETSRSASPLEIPIPCAVAGRLVEGDEKDVFAFEARRGEVLWIEGIGSRLGSPVDLDISVLDGDSESELAHFDDQVRNLGGRAFPTQHLDPAGCWVSPRDGRFLIVVRNLMGGLDADLRRVYALTIRRQEADFDVVAIPSDQSPESLNLRPNGRTLFDLLAFRRRGMNGPIRVFARNIPPGVSCPPIWLGPGVEQAPLVISADREADEIIGPLELAADAPSVGERTVQFGTSVRSGYPEGWGRLTDGSPVAISGEPAPLRITADGHETRPHHLYGDLQVRHSPGGILDVAIHVERADMDHQAAVKLIGVGLPPMLENQTATIPPGKNKGYLSFYLPPTLELGRYTLAVRADTTAPDPDNAGQTKTVVALSNPVVFELHRPAFVVKIDPYAPKTIRRGEVVKINYTARRLNGFISKIHTELAAAEAVSELRGRGVTFVGQTESGTIQIVANDDAKLGRHPFLRLYAVGVLEDEPIYHGSCFLNLEIVE